MISLISIEKANAEINDSLFMTVGNKAITQSDVVNEIKLILILNNESYLESKKDQLHKSAIQSIIRRNIKQIEIERHDFFKLNEKDFEKELVRLSNNINVDVDTLKNICASNELDFSLIEDQVKIELYWNSLIFELYKTELSINKDKIDEELQSVQKEKKLKEHLISEILIEPVEKSELESEIERLKNKIKIEGFENVAKSLSISKSSNKGGDLGWISESEISEKMKSTIVNTPVGNISEPIILPEGILFFKIMNKREAKKNLSLEERKNQLVNLEKTKILNMHSLSHYDKLKRSISVKFIK